MAKLSYNTDFNEIFEPILFALREAIKDKYEWTSIMNGYETGTNNAYFNGFRPSKKAYPVMFKITVENDWMFVPWNGAAMKSTDDWDSNTVGGGRVVFDKTLRIILSMQLERLDINKLNGFQTEAEEFKSIKSIVIEHEFVQSDMNRRKITKASAKKITKDMLKQLPDFLGEIEKAIKIQAARRFDELHKADEEVAFRYMPDDVKEMFIF